MDSSKIMYEEDMYYTCNNDIDTNTTNIIKKYNYPSYSPSPTHTLYEEDHIIIKPK
jgi:hypothetical protein